MLVEDSKATWHSAREKDDFVILCFAMCVFVHEGSKEDCFLVEAIKALR
jgi:hypothetical protein